MEASRLEGLGYRELQAECKQKGVSARGTKAELIARLLESGGDDQQPASPPAPRPASPTKSPAAAKSAAKTPGRRSAAAAAARPSDEVGARTPATTSRKAPGSERLLQTASKTPLPATPPTNGSIPVSPLTTARKSRRAAAPKPAVGRVLLLAAVVAALSALAIPACQKYECGSRLREQFPGAMEQAEQLGGRVASSVQAALPAGLLEAASQRFSQAHGLAQHHWQSAQRQCTYLVHTARLWVEERLQGQPKADAPGAAEEPADLAHDAAPAPAAPSCLLNTEALHTVMPVTDMWANLKEAATAVWQGQRIDPSKATAMLFACVKENCQVINDWLAWSVPEDCRLRLEASELGGDRGALQKLLAEFVAQKPGGVVFISNIHNLSPELLPALINATSEQGGFEQDGRTVRTSGNLFMMSMEMPRNILESASEADFKVAAKGQLVEALAQGAANTEEAHSQAKALRRRFEFVLPTVY